MGIKKLGLAALLVVCAFSTGASAAPDAKKADAKKATAAGVTKSAKPRAGRKRTAKKVTAKKSVTSTTTSELLAAGTAGTSGTTTKTDSTILAAKVSVPPATTSTAPSTPAAVVEPARPTATAALLSVTCTSSSKDPRCGRPMWGSGATLGAGPAIHGTSGFPSTGEGFVDGNRLVIAVEMGAQMDDQGAVMGIDLKTGDRTILSGKIEDPAKGPVVVGTGPDLGNVRAVTQAGSSWLAMVSKGSLQPVQIIRIDPKTGARTLERSLDAGRIPACTGSTAKLYVDFTSGIAASPDGTSYVAVGNSSGAVGLVAFKGATCNVVTMSGAAGFETKGAGPTVDSLDRYRSLRLDGGKVWALHGMTNSLMTIDIATGNRARISSGESSTKVGGGEVKLGYKMLALAGSKVWTSGGWVNGGFALTEVASGNGQRTGHDGATGPASHNDDLTGVWVHPTKPLLIVAMDNSFGLYDPATGNSVLFSE